MHNIMYKIFLAIVALVSILSNGAYGESSPQTAAECVAIQADMAERGLVAANVQAYCAEACAFRDDMDKACTYYANTFSVFTPKLAGYFRRTIDTIIEDPVQLAEVQIYSDATADQYFDMLRIGVMAMLALIPLLITQSGFRGGIRIAITIATFLAGWLISADFVSLTLISLICVIGLGLPTNSDITTAVVSNAVATAILAVSALAVESELMSIAIGVVCSGYIVYMMTHGMATGSKMAVATLAISLLQLGLAVDIADKAFTLRAVDSPAFKIIVIVYRFVGPHGSAYTYMQNSLFGVNEVSTILLNFGVGRYKAASASIIACYIVPLALRCVYGTAIRVSVRARPDRFIAYDDIMYYFCDLYSICTLVSKVIAKPREAFTKRPLYCVGVVVNTAYELRYAHDLLMLRFVITVACCMSKSSYSGIARLLSYDFEIDASQLSFPQLGAFAFISRTTVARAIECTLDVHTKLESGRASGTCVRTGPNTFVTAKHVLDGAHAVKVDTVSQRYLAYKVLHENFGTDPAIHFCLDDSAAFDRTAPVIPPDDIEHEPSYLLYTKGDHMTVITEYNLDRHNNAVYAAFNAKPGDSGSPIYAVSKYGEITLFAVVSAGVTSTTSGNRASLVHETLGIHPHDADRDPGGGGIPSPTSSLDESIPTPATVMADLTRVIGEIRADLDGDPETTLRELPSREEGTPGDAGPSNHRVKSSRKDRRARKAGFLAFERVSELSYDCDRRTVTTVSRSARENATRAFNIERSARTGVWTARDSLD